MRRTLIILSLCLCLQGCEVELTPENIETGQKIIENEELKAATQEVVVGGQELFDTGQAAVTGFWSSTQKILTGAQVIFKELKATLTPAP